MSRKIARITQDKKLLLANEVVESNAKTSLNSDGRLDTDEIIEYPAELEGGRNLAPIKDYSHDNQFYHHYQTVTKTDETFNGQPVYRAIKKTTSTPPTSIGSITIKKGETFTASIWIKHEQQPTLERARLIFYKNTTLKSVSAKNNYGEWERLIVTYTNNTDADIENVYIYFYPARGVGEVTYFTCPKIEKGPTATPWTPAPEDLGLNYPDSIQNFNSSISGNNIIVPEFIEGYPFVKPVIDDSLVLWLDGSTGSNYEKTNIWKDLSGNGNDGQLMNFGYTEGSGWVDGGLKFDGVDDLVNVRPDFDFGTDSFTIEIMAKHYSYERPLTNFAIRNNNLAHREGEKGFQIGHGHYSSGVNVVVNDGTNLVRRTIGKTPELNEKVHAIFVFDRENGNLLYFYDGELVGELDISEITGDIKHSNLIVIGYIAGWKPNMSLYLFRLYNRALTDEEILQNYQAGQCSPLLAMRGEVIG